jgi:purine nucleoside phosphorylase
MYSEHTGDDYRNLLGLSPQYEVEGVLAYGTWDLEAEANQLPLLREELQRLGIAHELTRMRPVGIGHAHELTVEGRHYWFVPVMGTAVMAQYLHIAALLGSKRNILLGVVGGLRQGMQTADFLVPTQIFGNENARYYDRENTQNLFEPDALLQLALREQLPDTITLWEGATTTCEMMLAETPADVAMWSAAGFMGVEMEGALTFALSSHFNIPAAALFYVADNLAEAETMVSESYARHRENHRTARGIQYRAGLLTLLGLTAGA